MEFISITTGRSGDAFSAFVVRSDWQELTKKLLTNSLTFTTHECGCSNIFSRICPTSFLVQVEYITLVHNVKVIGIR